MNKQPEIKVSVEMKLSINGVDCKYPQDLDDDTAQQIERQIMMLCLGQGSVSTVTVGAEQPESLSEYLARHAPKTHREKILVVGAFLHEIRNRSSFQQNDIKEIFDDDLKKDAPGNFSRDFNKCVDKLWIVRIDGGNYRVGKAGNGVLKEMLAKSG